MSQPFAVAQVFTGFEGRLVSLKDTVRSFKEILSGQHDSLPESAFYMVIVDHSSAYICCLTFQPCVGWYHRRCKSEGRTTCQGNG
jgi:hypothetical protein